MREWFTRERVFRRLTVGPRVLLPVLLAVIVLGAIAARHYQLTSPAPEPHDDTPVTLAPEAVSEDLDSSGEDGPTPISIPDAREVPEATQDTEPALDTISSATGYPTKQATATVFWAGEAAGPDNSYIHNKASAFDTQWETSYGGYDDPNDRCGYYPCAFTPKQNPLYVALPYSDLTDDGMQKHNASEDVPWFRADMDPWVSQVQGRMIAVEHKGTVCYGWWADVGPYETHDVEYVFGSADTPLNTIGMSAGIDVSPGLRDCLGMGGVGQVTWWHVDREDVPDGPWSM